MGEIADLGARALDDLAVGVDQLIDLGRQRGDVLRKFAGDMFGLAAADRRPRLPEAPAAGCRPNRTASAVEPISASASVRKVAASAHSKLRSWRLDHVGVGGDLHQEAPVVAGVDLALDHPQLMPARADRVAAQNRAVIVPDRDELRQLGREQRLRGADFRRVHVGAGDLPVPARERELELRRDRRRRRGLPLFVRDRDIGDQRFEIDAELVVEIGLGPLLVERAQAQPGEREDEDAPERRREKKARSDRPRAERLEHEDALRHFPNRSARRAGREGGVGAQSRRHRPLARLAGFQALAPFASIAARRCASSASSTRTSIVRAGMSIAIMSPSSTRPIAPPSAASGETWPIDRPEVPPEKRPSVTSAHALPSPRDLR